jgi:hypothetical protein
VVEEDMQAWLIEVNLTETSVAANTTDGTRKAEEVGMTSMIHFTTMIGRPNGRKLIDNS